MRGKENAKRAVAVALSVSMLAGGLSGWRTRPAYGAQNGTYGVVTETPGEKTVVSNIAAPSSVRLADRDAVPAASELYAYLEGVGKSDYVLYGHQNDTHHKGGGTYEGSTSSDTKDLTGSIAAVCGIDSLSLTGAEMDIPEGKRDSVDEASALSVRAANEGAIITLSAHMPNFALVEEKGKNKEGKYDYSGYSPGDATGNIMGRILPGGDLNEVYNGYLDLIAGYGLNLQAQGIPVLFRPLHENNGSWFWWGAAYCDAEGYKNVYRYTVEYLRDVKGVHNFLYMYSPNGPFEGAEDYESRYPGDAYVDIIAFDMYHDNPEAADGWMDSFRDTVALVEQVAQKHGKVPAVAETGMRVTTSLGDGMNYGGIAPFGNRRQDWFREVEEIVSASDMPYFLVWANFDGTENFFTPYKVDSFHGHEMSDAFIRFYNSARTVFADGTNFYGQVAQPFVAGNSLEGYFLSPASGAAMLSSGRARVSLSERAENVQIVLLNEEKTARVQVKAEEKSGVRGLRNTYTAQITGEMLEGLGETVGTMELWADGQCLSAIPVVYNIEEIEEDPMTVDRFENYHGKTLLMQKEWSTNSGTGCAVTPELTADHKSEGEYGAAFCYQLSSAAGEGWAGMTKAMDADWSGANALQLWIKPDGHGQKLVVQLTSGGEDFEVYLPEFAATTEARYVTVPFGAMQGKNGGMFDPAAVTGFGLWCNTIGQVTIDSVIYVDDIHAVAADNASVSFSDTRTDGITAGAAPEEENSSDSAAMDPELMRLGPAYANVKTSEETPPAANVTVTELLPEGSYEKYETQDVSWLTGSAPTDYVTVEYTCTDALKGGWGILGWGASVDGAWVSGPSYNASKENPVEKASVMVSVQALRRNFKLKKGAKLDGIYLTGWNGGRITRMTLTRGGVIPYSPVLVENASADWSWECKDIEYLRDLPDDKILSLTITCNDQGHSKWEIMSWGAKVNGQWIDGPKYIASTPASQKMQISYTMKEFREMMGMEEDASVEYLGLSVYNGGQIMRLAVDDERKPSFFYNTGPKSTGSGSGGSGSSKADYVSPNGGKYLELAGRAENEEENTLRFDEMAGTIDGWGQLDAESAGAAGYVRPGNYIVVKYSSFDPDTVPALWPKAKDGIYQENYRTVGAAWSNGVYAVFTYDAIAARLKKCLLPTDLRSLSIAANGSGSLDIAWMAVVSDQDLELVNEMNRITELYAQHKLDLTDYNSEYVKGDTVTVTVTLDREAKGYIGTNIGGAWNQGGELSGTLFTRTMKPDSGDVYVSISDFMGASYVEITGVRVDIAGKVNYDAAVEIDASQSLGIVSLDPKELTEAAGMTGEEVASGGKLVVTMTEVTDESVLQQVKEKLEAETVDGKKPTALTVIDISLTKIGGDGTTQALTSTDGKLRFTFAVPEGADISQKFVVARVHDGRVEWLEDLDDNPNTVTIESDQFSEYVISALELVSDEQIAENAVYAYNNLSRVKAVMDKAAKGESVTIAFLGGSITNGSVAQPQQTSCYAYLTWQWWEDAFPDADITYINAGIGATDSYLGVHRVEPDVLSHEPDLVVVEFSVNDYRDHNQETYESLIRRILQSETNPAVIALFVTQWTSSGSVSDYSDYHKEIADYYHIPAVSYRDVVGPMLESGELKWTDIGPADDMTHPNNAGHEIISRCMTFFFEQVLSDDGEEMGDYEDYEMPSEPETYSRYENGQILDHRSSRGISVDGSVEEVTVSEAQFPYGWRTTAGGDVTFTIEDASNIGLIYYGGMSNDYGTYDVYVDGTYRKTVDTNFYGSWGSHADYEILLTSGSRGSHEITLKKSKGSTGNLFTVLGFTVSGSDAEIPDDIYIFHKDDIKVVNPENPNYKEASHDFTLSEYMTEPVDIGEDVVKVDVILEPDGSCNGSIGLAVTSETNSDGDWVSHAFSGSGEIHVSFTETPRWDSMMIAVNSMDGEQVKVKSIQVSKADVLTPEHNTYEFDVNTYLEDYEAGDEITVSAVFSREVEAAIGTGDDTGTPVTGREISRTFIPESGMLTVTVTNFKEAKEVQLKEIHVERKGVHTFTKLWNEGAFEGTLSAYNPDFEAGEEVKVTVKLDKTATGNIAGNLKDTGWDTGDSMTGTRFVRTFVPRDDYLNIYLSDMGGHDRVQILSITVEQEKAQEPEGLHTFTEAWNAFTTTISEYDSDFEADKEVKVTVDLDKEATGYINGNVDGIWNQGEAQTGTRLTRAFIPSDDYLDISIGDMNGNTAVKILSITVEQEHEPEDVIYTFGGTWKDGAFECDLSSYMENPDAFEPNRETTVRVTLDEEAQIKLRGTAGEPAGWTESPIENGREIQWTFTPAEDSLNVQVGTAGVSITSIEVIQETGAEDALYMFEEAWEDGAFECDLSGYMETPEAFTTDIKTTVTVILDKAAPVKLAGYTGEDGERIESDEKNTEKIKWTFTPSSDDLIIQVGTEGVSILSITVEQKEKEEEPPTLQAVINQKLPEADKADAPETDKDAEQDIKGETEGNVEEPENNPDASDTKPEDHLPEDGQDGSEEDSGSTEEPEDDIKSEGTEGGSGTTDKEEEETPSGTEQPPAEDKNPPSGEDATTGGKDPSAEDNAASKEEDETSSGDKETSSEDKETSSEDKGTSSGDKETSSGDRETSTDDREAISGNGEA